MSKRLGGSTIVVLISVASAWAQTAASKRAAFEVAVIKPLDLQQAIVDPGFSQGLKVTGEQMTFRGPLEMVLELAYGVSRAQIDGADGLTAGNGGLFDISAKLPEGATEAQVPLMLQSLLEERFKAVIRKGSKQSTIYALVTGKDGIKFPKKDSTTPERTSSIELSLGQGEGQIGGNKISEGAGGLKIESPNPGTLVFLLTKLMQPAMVVDKTGLQGTFDIKLEIRPLGNLGTGPLNADDIGRMRTDAVSEALGKVGLKLEAQKSQIDTIVIEHLEKLPTEN